MDFKWAKKAISIAQKRIDAVLDINPEDETNEFVSTNSSTEPQFETVLEQDEEFENKEGWDLGKDDANSWSAELPNDFSNSSTSMQVVDAEPNPIRDSHYEALYQHSPASNSPDEGCSGDDHDASSDVNGVVNNCINVNDSITSSEFTLSETQKELKSEGTFSHNVNCEDALTVVSSDIEVLRQGDSCSVVSSTNKKNGSFLKSSHDNLLSIDGSEDCKRKEEDVNTLKAEVAQLRVQIQYQERRNSDLQARNQKLEKKTREYLASKAACAQHNAAEAMFKKKLSEKEAELASLLKEGEKLAETNGKLSKELKRVKKLVSDQDVLTKKISQLEIDYDVAKEEIRTLTSENNKLRGISFNFTTIKTMEGESSKVRNTEEILATDLKKRDEKIEKLTSDLQEAEAGREVALDEVKKLELEIHDLKSKVDEREISNKDIEEIRRGLSAAIDEERQKNERQAIYIDSLEKRLSELMEKQRETAEMVALANQPLLLNIQELRDELQAKERDFNDALSQKENTLCRVVDEKNDLIKQNKQSSDEITKLCTSNIESQRVVIELSTKVRDMESNYQRLEANFANANKTIQSLKSSLSEKEGEVENLYVRLRAEAENSEKLVSEKEKRIAALIKRCEDAECELSNIREKCESSHSQEMLKSPSVVSVSSDSGKPLSLPHVSLSAVQTELVVLMEKYEQSMRQVASLQAELTETENDSKLLRKTRKELQARILRHKVQQVFNIIVVKDLRTRYESLLEAHGEKIERIEELELDLEDVKKLFREQMEILVGKS